MPEGFHSSGPGYWRSLQERASTDEFVRRLEAEFPTEAEVPVQGMSRRRFLQIMSASVALAGLAGCQWPEEEIIPFGKRPEGYQPGKLKRFATTLGLAGVARPVLVSSFDGRPIKVEGNPEHPLSEGAADVLAQASILELYDPDRSRNPRRRAGELPLNSSWEEFEGSALAALRARTDGNGLALLIDEMISPSEARLVDRMLQRYPGATWTRYAPVSRETEVAGARLAFGEATGLRLELDDARVLVDLDADLLVHHPTALRNARQFARGRHPDGERMHRLYSFETAYSATGAMADHRYPVSGHELGQVLLIVAAELAARHDLPHPELLEGARALASGASAIDPGLRDAAVVVARDLAEQRGHGALVLGARYGEALHALVLRINQALGNLGRTIVTTAPPGPRPTRDATSLKALVDRMNAGRVTNLVMLGGNPVYDAPTDLGFAAALSKVTTSIHLSLHENETSRQCSWHLPLAHPLESWGDLRAADGSLCAVQPLIQPLWNGRTVSELLSQLADDEPRNAYAITRQSFFELGTGFAGGAFESPEYEDSWRRFLHEGFDPASAAPAVPRAVTASDALWRQVGEALTFADPPPSSDRLELRFAADSKLHDGRFANNAWLQELPDFVTKLTWDNAALVSPGLAEEYDLEHGDLVRLLFAQRELDMPVYVLPGHARHSVTVNLGYGRTSAGRVGDEVGFDTYRLRASDALWGGPGLSLQKLGRKVPLACTQDHYAIDPRGREARAQRTGALVREGTLREYREHPEFTEHRGVHHPPLESLWKERQSEGHRWGMAVDLNTCVGCNACVVACQAENNIPVVGKEQVSNGREMHWLRLDRYFRGEPDNPQVVQQPLACGHCEMAPCEQVCPVAATVHSEEGLNVMVYNRCVGTRYCSNNCPYKVRQFNFFNYQKTLTDVEQLVFNPEVSVRARGVMEKCTYCVQRIEHARITAKNEGRSMRDGDIVTACQQTCPTDAIVFGDLSDPEARVSHLQADNRAYELLAELNLKPRTSYMSRIRNPHPDLGGASAHGSSASGAGHGDAPGGHGDASDGHAPEGQASDGHDGGGH